MIFVSSIVWKAGKNQRSLKASQIGGLGCASVGSCQREGRHAEHGGGDGYFGLCAIDYREQ
jgi:hypothetical protein